MAPFQFTKHLQHITLIMHGVAHGDGYVWRLSGSGRNCFCSSRRFLGWIAFTCVMSSRRLESRQMEITIGRSEETPKAVISKYELRVGRVLLSRFPSYGGVRCIGPSVVELCAFSRSGCSDKVLRKCCAFGRSRCAAGVAKSLYFSGRGASDNEYVSAIVSLKYQAFYSVVLLYVCFRVVF